VVDAIKQAMGSFVNFTFSTKFLCGVNQICTYILSIYVQISQSYALMSRNVSMYISRTPQFFNFTVPPLKIIGVRFRSIRPKIMSVLDEIAKKFGFEKLTGFLNYKPDLI
jgi:hypothetical protein